MRGDQYYYFNHKKRIIIHNYVINITANATMDVKDLR